MHNKMQDDILQRKHASCIQNLNVKVSCFCVIHFELLTSAVLCSSPASLIRGNRRSCAQFSASLDWLVERLDQTEASTGFLDICCTFE